MHNLSQALSALSGALVGGLLTVLGSWLAQRVQINGQWLAQEIQRRQLVYSDFIEAAARCYADALRQAEPIAPHMTKLYGAMGRMRLQSSPLVIAEANHVTQQILETYRDANRNADQIRDFLAEDSVDLFGEFGRACRAELRTLQLHWGTRELQDPRSGGLDERAAAAPGRFAPRGLQWTLRL
jgi:hypothetical protein